jgi:homoserine dehydrogenase
MKHQKIALLGFGNVGQAFTRLLQRKRDLLLQDYGLEFNLTAIATARHGMAIDPRGIEIERALQVIPASGNLNELSTIKISDDPFEFIRLCVRLMYSLRTPRSTMKMVNLR